MKKQKLLESPKKQLCLKRIQKLGQNVFFTDVQWRMVADDTFARFLDMDSTHLIQESDCSMHQMVVKQRGFVEKQNPRRLETCTDEHHEAKKPPA